MTANELNHIAIIMDGNGRWATRQGLPRSMGHRKGAEVVKTITKAVAEEGIKYLTLYAFSTENWQRSEDEVSFLMNLLRQYLKNDLQEIKDNKIRICFIGERNMLDKDIQEAMANLEKETENFDKMTLCIALSYGSRQEIILKIPHKAEKYSKPVAKILICGGFYGIIKLYFVQDHDTDNGNGIREGWNYEI